MLTNVFKMLIEVDSPIYCLYETQSRLLLFPHIDVYLCMCSIVSVQGLLLNMGLIILVQHVEMSVTISPWFYKKADKDLELSGIFY